MSEQPGPPHEMDVAVGEIEVMGELTAGLIIFGEAGADPLLGVTALESAGIEVDPRNQQLKKLPAVHLKKLVRRPPDRADPDPGGDETEK